MSRFIEEFFGIMVWLCLFSLLLVGIVKYCREVENFHSVYLVFTLQNILQQASKEIPKGGKFYVKLSFLEFFSDIEKICDCKVLYFKCENSTGRICIIERNRKSFKVIVYG